MAKRPIELEDLLKLKIVGDTNISPDGTKVAFTVRRVDAEKNKYRTRICVADATTGLSRPFTGDGHSDTSPRWSPDGTRIAFVSDRDEEKPQIYLIPADGGEARALTSLDQGGIEELAWSPDGRRIAFLFTKTPENRTKTAAKEREESGASSPVCVHSKLFYRLDGMGYFNDAFEQIEVVDVATGTVHALTDEPYHHGSIAWSPDGTLIGFIANRRDDSDLTMQYDDIWTIPAAGGEPTRVVAPDGPKTALTWSPDGTRLAYVGHTDPDDTWGGRNERVLVIPAAGSETAQDMTGGSDLQVGYSTLADSHDVGGGSPLTWSPDGASIYCAISARGDTRLCRVDVATGAVHPLTPEGHEMGSFTASRDGKSFGLLLGTAVEPHEAHLGVVVREGMAITRLSCVNLALCDEVEPRMPIEYEAASADGTKVQGWELRPADFDPSKRYPCVVYVHGGPAAQYGGRSTFFHELQWLAANGYVVVFANPRGSKGYGEAHTSAIKGDWGNKDWADVEAVTDRAAALPYIDAKRMAIMGGSYGGYMTAWAVGHTDRYACAIADRLVGNIHSMSGTCDFPWQHGKEWAGNAWDDPSDMWRCSPLAFAGRIATPLLLIHSDGDMRCPIGQAEELFAALRMQRKVVEMVRYPAESSHGLSRNGPPDLRVDRLKRNLAWLDRWLKVG